MDGYESVKQHWLTTKTTYSSYQTCHHQARKTNRILTLSISHHLNTATHLRR
jgi:hypothetical protein